ncbi:M56 family metallopeptidase [Sphingobium boeckii]|uniref:Beta-lactamase regulating signal transducer with metallopeptidase domain n=1 Tax=Sphingobium boeckii TaxID=1082345 RepID=A0A7W9AHJ2_9SPHN|nr:M56 family metallopeptidase [Sphingobium boeckii]MBB5685584.1 beta-lactamase regulating signal transducer with metallopeptidase domain [Sphingobium boeckii]
MTGWILETLIASTLLMGLVLLVRDRVATRFGARIAYLLWLLPALRMILPPLPESFGPPPLAHIPVIVDISAFAVPGGEPMGAVPAEQAFPWLMAMLALWLAGAVVHLSWHLISYRRFVRAALDDCTDLPELDVRGIEVCASRAVEGPFAAGIFLPRIVLPHDYRTRYSAEELRLAMRHEAIHHDRGDIPVNLLALAMLSLHWFNPLAHRAWRAFRTDQELACDAIVLEGASGAERHSYGLALVKSACTRTPVAACSLNPRDQLKKRLRMMRGGGERRLSGTMLAAMLVGGGLIATASGGIAAETTREMRREMKEKVIVPAVEAVGMATPPMPVIAPEPLEPMAAPPPPEPADVWPPEASAEMHAGMENARKAQEEGLKQAEQARRAADMARRAAEVEMRRMQVDHSAGTALVSNGSGAFAFSTPGDCQAGDGKASVAVSGGAGKAQRTYISVCGAGMSEAKIARVTLDALTSARRALAEDGALNRDHRTRALAGMDREIARLKDEVMGLR